VADACRYLEEAIASDESDEATDAQYYYELAAFAYKNNMRGKASECAKKAVEMDYGYAGKAYMILGNLWASASCSGEVDKYARYWAATDYYQKARNADASIAEDASASISSVSRYYPEASEIFMYDLSAGQSYTVTCGGMSAFTTVRVSGR
jgi:tetratricopeptide (TPR) repeat protein